MRTQRILILVAVLGVVGLGYVALRGSSARTEAQPGTAAARGGGAPRDNEVPPEATASAGTSDLQPASAAQPGTTAEAAVTRGYSEREKASDIAPAAQRSAAQAAASQPRGGQLVKATFASGCFWCTESDFDKVPGVVSTTSGYTGGTVPNPTYEQVSSGATGHAESVEIVFDSSMVSYQQLLDHYWHNVDPFNARGQFCDVGEQYRPAIFVHDAAQRAAAEASKAAMQKRFSKPIVVSIVDAGVFYPAEEYHQDFHNRNSVRYTYYRWGCGRDARLAEIWGKPSTD